MTKIAEASGYDKLAELRLAALGGSLGQEYSAEDRADAEDVLMASAPVLAEVIGELRAELEREAEWWRMKALERPRLETNAISVSMDELSRRNVACRQALTNTDKKLQEALDG